MRSRPRGQSYRNIDGVTAERDAVSWYWRLVAIGSSFMILGGYLMLPATFDNDPLLRVSKSVVGIFAVALLTAGFSFTALLCFAVRNPLFQADAIFLPSLTSCALGLLTVFYDFLISSRYIWNTPALLLTIAASLSTIVYGALLIYTLRKIGVVKAGAPGINVPMRPVSMSSTGGTWQDSGYYENYVRNMYPASAHQPQPMGYDPNAITEEEMQRQQMLMLLLQKEQPPTPDPSQSTFRIDWQGQEQDDAPPHGYYAPQTAYPPQSAYPQTAYTPQTGISRQWTAELPPWDRVWRGPQPPPARGRVSSSVEQWQRATSGERREERRREIEMGR
ncbi:hypothetical protein LTR36_006260 [Oleoguttula mirabilis]|uniref:Uncharacterized protein n=1 Tax=Oleoguttula mirabilis TaxID=1507867 RepID=A0AAV9JCB8_9PEZI|nr:hypothetical protein LTR36_006260 [Oleoguttula mirabilis]